MMKPIIYGHRGVPTKAPENSLKGFSLLLKYNIPGVELDIHLTKDNKLVVIHDFNTKKMTGVDLEVSKTNYSELEKLDIGEGEKIPLLEEVFTLLGTKILYDLEIKSNSSIFKPERKILVREVIKLVLKYNLKGNIFVSSFDPFILKEFNMQKKHTELKDVETGIIYSKDNDVPFLLRSGLGAFFTKNSIIKPHYSQLRGFLYFVLSKVLKMKVATWTVNEREHYDNAIKNGATGICTNHPVEFLEFQ